MGKTWVRGGGNQARQSRPEPTYKPKRNDNVWTRDSASGAQRPESVTSNKKSTAPADIHGTSSGPAVQDGSLHTRVSGGDQAAKRRRLVAKGRYVFVSSHPQPQPGAASERTDGDAQEKFEERAQKEATEAEARQKLQQETNALRKRIAEEEARVLAAKVGLVAPSIL